MKVFDEHITDFNEGVIIPVIKPYSWTSFQLVKKIRYLLKYNLNYNKIKIGHAGTLDPLATGLLLICTGKATKKIAELQELPKTYRAEITLGAVRPSYDRETEISKEVSYEHITREMLEKSLNNFKGEITQMPPAYSALKTNGKRAYQLARQGKEVNLKERTVKIFNIDLLNFEKPNFKISVKCSKGTYIRSLASDIGKSLSSGAYLNNLIRTEIGEFNIDKAYNLDFVEKCLRQ